MKTALWSFGVLVLSAVFCSGLPVGAEPSLTVYNQNFAVVRETIPLNLTGEVTKVAFSDITAHVEPDSVILRDPAGAHEVVVLEQNYRADPVSQGLLLSMFEGQTIDFRIQEGDQTRVAQGKIVRSAYTPHTAAMQRYGQQYMYSQQARAYGEGAEPIIEIDGKLRFGLPGTPLFPSLADETVLKPTLEWSLRSGQAGAFDAELCYITGGMSWEASYNLVAPEKGDTLDVIGWVTMDNQSGKTFENASIKLMAGDVSRIQEQMRGLYECRDLNNPAGSAAALGVTERSVDEYHLYTLERPTTLRDRETKQVEFIRAAGVKADRFYVYDGVKIDSNRYRGYDRQNILRDQGYGTACNPKVWTMCEFKNTQDNHLGMPLPKGRTRFYHRDGSQLEFTGENVIDHTPKDETVRVYTGSAFDLVGERKCTEYKIDDNAKTIGESFEIRLRNRKEETVEIRVVEHLYRWHTWSIPTSSATFLKTSGDTVEFRVQVAAGEEQVVTYTAHYTW